MSLVLAFGLFALIGLAHVGVQGLSVLAAAGLSWGAGPRDTDAPQTRLSGRARRALDNFLQTAPVFIALCLAADQLPADGVSAMGTWAYLIGRAAYLPAYLSGIPYLRTLCWWGATGGLVAMIVALPP